MADAGLVILLQLSFAVRRTHAGPTYSSQRSGRSRGRVDVAVRRLADAERGAIGPSLSDRLHFHVEARLLGTGDVKGCVTVGFVTLDAGARTTLLADVAGELPACRRNVLNTIDWLQKDCVSEADLRKGSKIHFNAIL